MAEMAGDDYRRNTVWICWVSSDSRLQKTDPYCTFRGQCQKKVPSFKQRHPAPVNQSLSQKREGSQTSSDVLKVVHYFVYIVSWWNGKSWRSGYLLLQRCWMETLSNVQHFSQISGYWSFLDDLCYRKIQKCQTDKGNTLVVKHGY